MQKSHEAFDNTGQKLGPTIIIGPSKKDKFLSVTVGPSTDTKSLLPNQDTLPMQLAYNAFKMIGGDVFQVSAELDVNDTKSLVNFKLFQDILMMAYQEGQNSR